MNDPLLDEHKLRSESEVIRDKGGSILGYVTLWKGKDGMGDPSFHAKRNDALEHAAEEYFGTEYFGTLTIFANGYVALCEDWSEEAAEFMKQKVRDWLDQKELSRDYYARVL